MKKKNIKFLVIVGVIGFIFIPMLVSIYTYEKEYAIYSHEILMNRSIQEYPSIAKSTDTISVDYCVANRNDTLSILTCNTHHRLIVWQITGFNKVSLDSIEGFEISRLEDLKEKIMADNTFGMERLHFRSQADTFLAAEKLQVLFESDGYLSSSLRGDNYLYMELSSRGIAISDENKKMKLSFFLEEEQSQLEVLLFKIDGCFHFAMLYPIDSTINRSIFDYFNVDNDTLTFRS